jgi:beta-exotoxin I transport system permease protein
VTAVASGRRAPARSEVPAQRRMLLAATGRALHDQRRSPLTWGVPLGLMSALEVAIYPSVEKSLSKALDSYPDALKEAFRIETIDTPAQFLNGEMYSLIIPLAIGFFAIRAASRPLVGYEERRWLDVVLVAPLRRRTLAAAAFLATAVSTLAILVVTAALSWLAGQIFGAQLGLGELGAAVVGTWAFALLFAGLALLACGRISSWTAVTGIAAGLLVAMYVVDIASRVADALHDATYGTVFHYYGSPLVDGLDAGHIALAGIGVLLAVLGAALFERRDISG